MYRLYFSLFFELFEHTHTHTRSYKYTFCFGGVVDACVFSQSQSNTKEVNHT